MDLIHERFQDSLLADGPDVLDHYLNSLFYPVYNSIIKTSLQRCFDDGVIM